MKIINTYFKKMVYGFRMFVFYFVLLISVIYLLINLYLFYFQRSLLYHPVKEISPPANYGLDNFKEITIKTSDDLNLQAWYFDIESDKAILYLHGNAGNLSLRNLKLGKLSELDNFLIAVSWRGFGKSEGLPTEEGLYDDAQSAINFLKERGYDTENIILYGESLGTGIAIEMATKYKFHSLILEAPYTSITNRAAELYPYIPVKILLKDKISSIDKIEKVTSPLLIYHGDQDLTMPVEHAKRLFEKAKEPKKIVIFENIGHTDFDLDEVNAMVSKFIQSN